MRIIVMSLILVRWRKRGESWPDLIKIVEERVKPERMKLGDNVDATRPKTEWWLWGRYTPALYNAIRGLDRVLVIARVRP